MVMRGLRPLGLALLLVVLFLGGCSGLQPTGPDREGQAKRHGQILVD